MSEADKTPHSSKARLVPHPDRPDLSILELVEPLLTPSGTVYVDSLSVKARGPILSVYFGQTGPNEESAASVIAIDIPRAVLSPIVATFTDEFMRVLRAVCGEGARTVRPVVSRAGTRLVLFAAHFVGVRIHTLSCAFDFYELLPEAQPTELRAMPHLRVQCDSSIALELVEAIIAAEHPTQ